MGGSWGADVLVAGCTGESEWGISVWVDSVMIWVSIGTIEQSWAGFSISISGSFAKVVSVSVSTAVSTISVSAIKTITIPTTISTIPMTISSITIVCVRGCFSLWLSNDSRKKGEGENGDFHHFDYELFEQNPHK